MQIKLIRIIHRDLHTWLNISEPATRPGVLDLTHTRLAFLKLLCSVSNIEMETRTQNLMSAWQ